MKFIKITKRKGFDYNHGTKYSVTDLRRSNNQFNFEAGVNRRPRMDSKFWKGHYMIWDVENRCRVN